LYYGVTGKVPFPGGRTRDKIRRHLEETPWHPRRFNPRLSEEFVDVIADTMEKDPRRRIQTAAAVAARLEIWAKGASAIPTQQLTRSPWQAPPPPTGEHDTASELDDEEPDGDGSDSRQDSPNQSSESTNPVASAEQETRVLPRIIAAPRLPARRPRSHAVRLVALALAIAIPLSMAAGGIIAGMIMNMLE
jgi:serine/threonine protein kinase